MPVPLLADVVGAFDGGAESLRVAFLPRYDAGAAVPWLGRAPSRALVAAALPCAVELAAVGLLQSLLTLQLVDGLTRDGPDGRGRASRECRALGAGNVVAGLLGGMGGCGLLGQSLVNLSSGGAARASGIFYVAFVAAALAAGGALLGALPVAVWKSNLQPDFNVRVFECFDTSPSAGLRELDESDRSVQKSAESTSI